MVGCVRMVRQDYLTNLNKQINLVNSLNSKITDESFRLLDYLVNQAANLSSRYLMEIRQQRFTETCDVDAKAIRNHADS